MANFLEKLTQAPAGSFHVLEAAKAKKMKAETMYIPSALDVANAIAAIPIRQTRTMLQLRQSLAQLGDAEIACPMVTTRYWTLLAQAEGELEANSPFAVPWWRVIKDRKPGPNILGGPERQVARLHAEGVRL